MFNGTKEQKQHCDAPELPTNRSGKGMNQVEIRQIKGD